MRRRARTGLCIHFALICCVSVSAYLGGLGPLGRLLELPSMDKVLHCLFVGGVAFWWTLGWNDPRMSIAKLALPVAVVVPLALATMEEGMQALSPRRSADPLDWLADLVGLFGFWLIARWWLRRQAGESVPARSMT